MNRGWHIIVLLAVVVGACSAATRVKGPSIRVAEPGDPLEKDTGAVGGVVRDAETGKILSMVRVRAVARGHVVAHDVSDFEGRYQLAPLSAGYYDVEASYIDGHVKYKAVAVKNNQESEVQISMDLRPNGDRTEVSAAAGSLGAIEGVVLDSVGGEPMPGVVVSLLPVKRSGDSKSPPVTETEHQLAGAGGSFRFSHLRPGRYSINSYYFLVGQGTVEVLRNNIVVNPGESTTIELVFDLRIAP